VSTVIKLKRGTTIPTTGNIESGEVAVDTSAQKLYINDSGVIKEIGGGGSSNSFTNILLSDSTTVAADSSTDTLTLANAGLIAISGDSATDTITISTPSTATIPFTKANGDSSNISLQTSGSIGDILTNLHIPFTKSDGSSVTTLVVGSA
jgi:hypothetical protein